MRNVKRYGLLGNIEDAHYVKYTLDAARLAGMSPELQPTSRQPSCGRTTNVATVAAGVLVLEGKSSVTASDGNSPPEAKPDGGGRGSASGINAERKRGAGSSGTSKSCSGGLGSGGLGGSNSDHLEASVQEI